MKSLVWCVIIIGILLPANVRAITTEILPEDFGAVVDDAVDDREAIQAALNAAAADGGGVVKLAPGEYHVRVIVANGLGGTSGYHGVVVPPGCTLRGSGPELTHITVLAGDANPSSIGDGIVNGGYQTAFTDFGAGGDILLADFGIDTPDTDSAPTGNLIGIAHADGVVISNLKVGKSRAHGLEINLSRNVIVEDCVFDGRHFGSSTLQLDMGYFGAKSLVPTGTVIRDILVRRCQFKGRADDSAYTTKVIELTHTSSNCIIRNIAFEDCSIESLTHHGSVCVTADNPPGKEISGLRFERCHFIGLQEAPSVNGLLQLALQGNQILEDLIVRDCKFTGMYTQGLVVISAYETQYGGWANRRRILVEGNTFSPTLDRPVPYSAVSSRLCTVAVCNDAIIRRNLFEIPATAHNLTLTTGRLISCMAVNNLDLRLEDNVFTWAHTSAATAPLGAGRLNGVWLPVSMLEQNGVASRQRITGNIFLAPPDGIYAAVLMLTDIPTTSWAQGGPWTGGLIAGNYISGVGGFYSPWQIHWDLSQAGNVGRIATAAPGLTRANGWYPANGASLYSTDSGRNYLPRVNATKCGYATNLPNVPGSVVRLHGPMRGEGLLQDWLSRYAGSSYQGTHDTPEDLCALSVADRFHGELRVVRKPLAVYRWEGSMSLESVSQGAVAPCDKNPEECGYWAPIQCGVEQLDEGADPDGDGLTTRQEIALMSDPMTADFQDYLSLERGSAPDEIRVRFRCASGPHSPRVCILSSDDLEHWQTETSCRMGTVFDNPFAGSVTESPSLTGREVILSSPGGDRRFWKLGFEP